MPTANCTRNCWIAGAILGFLVWIITAGIGPLRWYEGLFLGLVAAGLTGRFLIWLLCDGTPAETAEKWRPSPLSPGGTASQPQRTASATGLVAGSEPARSSEAVGPAGDAQLQGGGAARSMSGRNDIYAGAQARSGAAGDEEAATEPAAKSAGIAEPAAAEIVTGSDDLKKIRGVGPKLEELLHENGVTRYAQIAEWGEAEMDHFAELIGRMGSRIRSDDWVGQARTLARGGGTEFSKRVEKGELY
ncbi:hypothetical protein [Paracoccus alkanivorans]|uniref:Endonuclease n=1 Tax=Paracoccus alkanivorans TaxID=2116655 RepID=A0A3M0MC31_9RHOB|nr:hypothetical protein [Paracoccus alkanivorans]RMC33844.1 hypothetical protein C9E81_16255 [Paracoccus alkanivorans]